MNVLWSSLLLSWSFSHQVSQQIFSQNIHSLRLFVPSLTEATERTNNSMNVLHNDESICRLLTFNECEWEKCVDLKTVFDIPDDDQFHIQHFNVSFMQQVEASIQDFNGIIFDEVKQISIEEDDRKFEICSISDYCLHVSTVIKLVLEKKEYVVFEYEDTVEVCLVALNGGRESCPVDAIIYYSIHTFGGNACEGFFTPNVCV